ncbi:MAG TPA: YoaK family protein [Streptosporangiaceae bacterium]|nr:YoaK family protein [Streptosporangiaceae bacterium]
MSVPGPKGCHGLLLAGVGGFLDAYTFVGYGGVFANAQTGNIVLLGVDAQAGHWQEALLHIPPIVAFMLGVALAQMLAQSAVRTIVRRPTRWVPIAEIVVLAAAGLRRAGYPAGSFRVSSPSPSRRRSRRSGRWTASSTPAPDHEQPARPGHEDLYLAHGPRPAAGHRAALLALVTAAFAVGAGLGGLCTRLIHQQAAWITAAALMIALVAIVIETRRLDRRGRGPAHHPRIRSYANLGSSHVR